MVFIYPSGNSDHKQDHSYKRKRRNRFWVYAIGIQRDPFFLVKQKEERCILLIRVFTEMVKYRL